ncbi:EAL domain-containing protein [Luteimonas sp. MJ250]|uniref:bifunctional diguanylate cyclase/phosphodiesterase n=1 Tax=Luteimonas sp. MJ250 TaxID=3129236 RepID=UPI0031BADECF
MDVEPQDNAQGTPGTGGRSADGADAGAARFRRAWWFGGTLVLCVLLAAVAVAWNDLRVRRDAGARYLRALVDSHVRQTGQQIRSIERAMHGLAVGLETVDGAVPETRAAFTQGAIGRIALGHRHLLDLRVEAEAPAFAATTALEPYHLQFGPAGQDAGGRWVLPLAMPFHLAVDDGQPTQWLRADLDAEAFIEVLQEHEVGPDGVSSLLDRDGVLIARSDTGTLHAGLDAGVSPVFSVGAGQDRGLLRSRSRLDGLERMVGYRHIGDRPLIATVGMTPDALYGGWRAFVATLACGMLLLTAAWLVGMWFLHRAALRERRMRRSVAASRDAVGHLREHMRVLRRAIETSDQGTFILQAPRDRLVYANAAFTRLTGVDPGAPPSAVRAALRALLDPVDVRLLRAAMKRRRDVRIEVSDRRAPRDIRDLEVRLAAVLDVDSPAASLVGVVEDVTLRKRAAEEMAFRASHDLLTGLANRDLLIGCIDRALADADGRFAVCHLDLDRFQLVNDSLGHGVGDELLISVARRLETAAGAGATLSRLGGDEFGILLPLGPDAEVPARVEALRLALAGTVEVRGAALHVTPSLGYSCFPGDGMDGTTLLRAASQAGARAKRLGRNRSVGYRSEFDSRAGDRLLLVKQLHDALEREEFELAFQLQFDCQDHPCGLEALVRWRHPDRGLLAPGAFMDVCEESGLVLPLGRWVLREAMSRWCLLDACSWGALRIGVNVSALQFQEGLVQEVGQLLAEFGLPRDRLELELTESVLLESPADARMAMKALGDLGVSLAIDDFGTGYSSMAYLKDLPVQRLKLDQSFVRDLGRDPESEAICEAILRMAKGLGLGVVAEGVEARHQHEWLRKRGCDAFQGYLLARPQDFDAVLERLRQIAAR